MYDLLLDTWRRKMNLFQSSVKFHIETSKSNDWFLYETQHWAEIG